MVDAGEILFGVGSFLSLIFTTFLILIYIFGSYPRTFAFHLVFMVCLNNFVWSIAVFPAIFLDLITEDAYLNTYLCNIQAFLMCFSTNSGFFYVISISSSLVKTIIKKEDISNAMRNPLKYYAPINILLPFAMAIIPITVRKYDHLPPFENVQCYLIVNDLQDTVGLLLRLFIFYAPYIFAITYQICTIVRILSFIKKSSSLNSSEVNEIKTLILYPFILCLTQSWLIISRTFEIFAGIKIDWLNHVDLFFFSLEGFLNVLVYGIISLDICRGIRGFKNKSQIWNKQTNQQEQSNISNSQSSYEYIEEIQAPLVEKTNDISSEFTINTNYKSDTFIYERNSSADNY
ncbi:hypothetical protein ABPG74_011265 [Tetrahymena malaccensis]